MPRRGLGGVLNSRKSRASNRLWAPPSLEAKISFQWTKKLIRCFVRLPLVGQSRLKPDRNSGLKGAAAQIVAASNKACAQNSTQAREFCNKQNAHVPCLAVINDVFVLPATHLRVLPLENLWDFLLREPKREKRKVYFSFPSAVNAKGVSPLPAC